MREARAGAAYPLVGRNTLDTLVTLYALLELRVPALLLHPKLTAAERAAEQAQAAQAHGALPADAAAVLYTSGTTGRAARRGADAPGAARVGAGQRRQPRLARRRLLAAGMPVARVGGLSIVTRCLAARRAWRWRRPSTRRGCRSGSCSSASRWRRWCRRCSRCCSTRIPAGRRRRRCARCCWAARRPRTDLLERAAACRLPIVITYGCTETCSQVVATPYERRFDAAACGAGRPLPGAQLRIDDGRIQVRGPMLMAGYLGEPPLAPGAWFDTGDLGELDAQGCLHLHARRADLIVTGGENVYPAEVERVLEACPGVRAAAVFGVADATWGHTVAAAVVAGTHPPSDQTLIEHLDERLAPHKRPRWICFVDSLPHTPAAKLDRLALPALTPALRPLRAQRG